MSGEARPKGKPVNPPMPNMGKKAKANSMAVLNRMDPPHREMNKQVKIIMEGIEIIIVVVWKNVLMAVPILVKYIWWAQTTNDKNPIAMME